jgi:hypothetical protein
MDGPGVRLAAYSDLPVRVIISFLLYSFRFSTSYMDTVADLAGVDIEVVVPEVPGVVAGMNESGEEIEVGEFTATLAYQLATGRGALREGRS